MEIEKEQGLSQKEAARRLLCYGPNQLQKPRGKNTLQVFVSQLADPLIYVLLAAAVVSILLKEYSDAAIIAVVVVMNGVIGTIQEGKAKRALEALQSLTSPMAQVIRDGVQREIPARDLVVGDLVCLEAGCRVPADLRLTESASLMAEESALTGESLPVEKIGAALPENNTALPLGDQKNRAFMSTTITAGRGRGIVIATGMNTQLGQIADMIHQSGEELTPLQKRLGELGRVLSILSLLLCAALFGIAVWQKRDVMQMLITAISLAVAAVPEGLPAVVTICLALSVTRMVKANTIVRRLPAVETLGAVSVVCSDKTGTLTQNHMTAKVGFWDGKIHDLDGKELPPKLFLQGLVLCNDARLADRSGQNDKSDGAQNKWQQRSERKKVVGVWKKDGAKASDTLGDPTEIALLELGRAYGMEKEDLNELAPRVGEIPFDSNAKQMTTYHQQNGRRVGYRKGAPDEVLKLCSNVLYEGQKEALQGNRKEEIRGGIKSLSAEGFRTLAVAYCEDAAIGRREAWTFLGLAALQDPPRPEVAEAVQVLKDAGVRTVMITGDHGDTALAIGKSLGIAEKESQCMTGEKLSKLSDEVFAKKLGELRIFARVSPAQKLRIVKAYQSSGEIVAMTGDGVNDAPSLKGADIGIAMGRAGTDVAKQASDMILVDDNFATIERAIEEGRGVYENIRKSVIFLLSSNLGELLTMFTAVVLGFVSPLKSSHILWINLITDSLPALALGVDPGDGRALMKNKPRKAKESLFARGGLGCTCFYGLLIAAISLTAFLLPVLPALQGGQSASDVLGQLRSLLGQAGVIQRAQTYAFTVLGMSQLFHAVGMRDVEKSIFRMRHLENKLMILALVLGFALQVAVTEVPFLVSAFETTHLSLREWEILAGLSAIPLLAHELLALFT